MGHANRTSFQIEGMTFASSVGRLDNALLAVPGVTCASVNLVKETAQVSYDDTVDAAGLTKTLADVGYAYKYYATGRAPHFRPIKGSESAASLQINRR